MQEAPLIWIMMGVAGSGKSLVGRLWAAQRECDFLEGDRRHPPANIRKMVAQIPLDDGDRQRWLQQLEQDIAWAIAYRRETVVTCSALKVAYRQRLMALGPVQLVWLNVPPAELERRLAQRQQHYMQPGMLASQLVAFEPVGADANVLIVDGRLAPSEMVADLSKQAMVKFAGFNQPWWERC
jgi:gluconokinase